MVADRPQPSDAELVRAAVGDDPAAFGTLFERWFDRVYDVARNIVRNDDTAAEVAQDVFLTSWQRLGQLDDPERFGGWLLRTSRNRALNRLEKERRAQPLEGDVMTGLHEGMHGSTTDRDDLVGSNRLLETEAISEARDQQSLVWAASAALGERDASLLDLQLRHQLSPAEIADELDLSANNAHQLLFRLRNKLGDAVANHQLWRDGAPRCEELAALVDDDPFDQSTNKTVQRHAARCETCSEERKRVVDPAKLFAAAPIAIAPPFLRDQAAAALTAQGVPMPETTGVDIGESGESGGEPNASSESQPPDQASTAASPDSHVSDSRVSDGHVSDGHVIDESASGAGFEQEHDDAELVGASAGPVPPAPTHRRRRLGFLVMLLAAAVAVLALLTKPAGEAEFAADTEPPADSTGEPEPSLVVPSSEPPSSTTLAPSETVPPTLPPTPPPTPTPTPPPTPTPTPPPTPTPTPTPSETPPPTPPPPAPVILRYTLSTPSGAIFCPTSTDIAKKATWLTEETTGVTLTTPNGTTSGGSSGSHTFCSPSGSVITLTATGPGGSVSETRTVS